jgi:hypothetical protein
MKNRVMKSHRIAAVAVAIALACGAAQVSLFAQQSAAISGTAKDEAKQPYTDYSVRARETQQGQIAGTATLDTYGAFSLASLGSAKYLVELVNKDGKVVCTEGPFDLSYEPMKAGVVIDCNKVPVAWWLLGAAAAAGITAGVVAVGPASASR